MLTLDFVLCFSLNKAKKRTGQTPSKDTKSKSNIFSPKLKSRNNEMVSKTEMKTGINKSSSCSENRSTKLTGSLNMRKGEKKTPRNNSTRKQNASGIFPFQDLISLTNLIFVLFSCEPCGLCDDGKLKTFHFILLVSLCVLCLVGVPFFCSFFLYYQENEKRLQCHKNKLPKRNPKRKMT